MVTRQEYEMAMALEVCDALQKHGMWIESIDGPLITVHGTPDYQVRITAIDPALTGGFVPPPTMLQAISDSLDAEVQDLADEETEGKNAENRWAMGSREDERGGGRYQIGIGTISGRSVTRHKRMAA